MTTNWEELDALLVRIEADVADPKKVHLLADREDLLERVTQLRRDFHTTKGFLAGARAVIETVCEQPQAPVIMTAALMATHIQTIERQRSSLLARALEIDALRGGSPRGRPKGSKIDWLGDVELAVTAAQLMKCDHNLNRTAAIKRAYSVATKGATLEPHNESKTVKRIRRLMDDHRELIDEALAGSIFLGPNTEGQ